MPLVRIKNDLTPVNYLSRKDHLVYLDAGKSGVDKIIAAIFNHYLCEEVYLYSSRRIDIKDYKSESIDPLYARFKALDVYFYVDQPAHKRPDIEFIKYIINNDFNNSNYIDLDETGKLTGSPYKCPSLHKKKLLFVFPGPIYPLFMGSHRRAFEMLGLFYKLGYDIDLLLTGDVNEAVRNALQPVCSDIHAYKNVSNTSFKRQIYRILSHLSLAPSAYPETLRERSVRISKSAAGVFCDLVSQQSYDVVFFNYLWYSNLAEKCGNAMKICDLHDIMFIRNKVGNNLFLKIFFSDKHAKSYEIEAIKKMDKVVTISKRDRAVLVKQGLDEKSVFIPNDYSIPFMNSQHTHINIPLRYGFIGSNMDANELAIDEILTKFWPVIIADSPEAELSIAGAISKRESVVRKTFFNDEIKVLGYVDSLQDFYKNIDILISPVVVAGGLNIKNVEATMSGTVVITNRLGAEPFHPIDWPFVANDGKEVVALVQDLRAQGDEARKRVTDLQDRLSQQYEEHTDQLEAKLFGLNDLARFDR